MLAKLDDSVYIELCKFVTIFIETQYKTEIKKVITSSFKFSELSKSFFIRLCDLTIAYSWLVMSCKRFSHFFTELSVERKKKKLFNCLAAQIFQLNLLLVLVVLTVHDSLDNLQQSVLSFSYTSEKFGMIEFSVVTWSCVCVC